MGNESSLDAAEHKTFMTFILEKFSKSRENVVGLVGDNSSTNKALENPEKNFLECPTHRFSIAMHTSLIIEEDLTSTINALMGTLKTDTLATKINNVFGRHTQTHNYIR